MTVASFRSGTRSDVVRLALISRLIILGGMVLSDVLVPDHNPGDDVLRFDLRLGGGGCVSGDASDGECLRCFCLEGHACDNQWRGYREQPQIRRRNPDSAECAASNLGADSAYPSLPVLIDYFYSLILKPNTKWDGARFLSLAVDPAARMPPRSAMASNRAPSEELFKDSEQAHAFFPLFPLCIRYLALFLLQLVPSLLLPSTFEGIVALAALMINTFCFAVAAIALFDMTYSLLRRSLEDLKQPEVDRASFLVAMLFCFNPASVFFTASYSESLFAALTFCGHALAARGVISLAVVPWTLATYVRSNGTFSSIWILLVGCGKVISQVYHVGSSSANADIPMARKFQRMLTSAIPTIISHTTMAVVIAFPVFYHERRGYEFHCLSETGLPLPNDRRPVWCNNAEGLRRFSLYGYVQRKHWNVGFLRYYELKQIPNFLLAFPVLWLGVMAAVCWIGTSWSHYMSSLHTGKKRMPKNYFVELFDWAIFALNECTSSSEVDRITNTEEVQEGDTPSVKVERALSSPHMLAHYAVLAGFCFVGTTIAHIQISTRLICSSCPALYCFLASLCFAGGENMVWWMQLYLIIFNFLGIVLHPNFLPWT